MSLHHRSVSTGYFQSMHGGLHEEAHEADIHACSLVNARISWTCPITGAMLLVEVVRMAFGIG